MNFRFKTLCLLSAMSFLVSASGLMMTSAVAAPAQDAASVKKTTSNQTHVKNAAVKKTSVKASAKRVVKKAPAKVVKAKVTTKRAKRPLRRLTRRSAPSEATLAGLRKTPDPLALSSSVAYVVDQNTGEELFTKNAGVTLPIASVTKLMTALVVAESQLPMQQKIKITRGDYVRSHASSKLRSGMVMTREAVLKAALMSSDNRAAHALARTYPGGMKAFLEKMNETAQRLGMSDSYFADPTGLDNRNHSTARDLAKLVSAANEHAQIRNASTLPVAQLRAGRSTINLHTTNRLIGDPTWKIGVQKTGFTTAAGRCMVLQTDLGDRSVVMVLLDSPNSAQRATDMRTMRNYVTSKDSFDKSFSATTPYEMF